MKKTLLLSAALVLGLTACSGGAASSVKNETVQTQTSGQYDVSGDGPASSEAGTDAFADAPTVKMQFAENQPSTSSVGINAEEFCKKVAERTANTCLLYTSSIAFASSGPPSPIERDPWVP